MTQLAKYHTGDLNSLMDRIAKTNLGWDDDYWNRLFNLNSTPSNYPPFNIIQLK